MYRLWNEKTSRRAFLGTGCRFLASLGVYAGLSGLTLKDSWAGRKVKEPLREAMFYTRLGKNVVRCGVCFHNCVLKAGARGRCLNKENLNGTLYLLVHSRPSAVNVEPIEKEPALHMFPGTDVLCVGTAGCNFRCRFCHNWHLSQRPIEQMSRVYDLSPEDLVTLAINEKVNTISFTYNEPTSFYEYAYDTAIIAKKRGLSILWHSNGGMNPEPLRELLKYTDSVTIDLKGFTEGFYRDVLSARLDPVLRTLRIIREEKRWLEIVNLHVPTLNDNPDDVRKMCHWIKSTLGQDVPLHFSRFSPSYRLTGLPATPIKLLEAAHRIAKEVGIDYVTIGNVPGHRYNSTFCPACKERLIHRVHFRVLSINLANGRCKFCGHTIPGIWS